MPIPPISSIEARDFKVALFMFTESMATRERLPYAVEIRLGALIRMGLINKETHELTDAGRVVVA